VLPTFNCIWICGVWEYYFHTGDATLLRELWPSIEQLLALLAAHESPAGLLQGLPGWVFVDWAPLDVRGEASHVNAFYVAGLDAAARIARVLGMSERGSELDLRAATVREAINDHLYDHDLRLYRDCRVDGVLQPALSEQANVLCALHGIADPRAADHILDTVASERARELGMTPIATPYFAFYLLRALYAFGRHEQALRYTRERWGDMLARGATSFWEQFEPHWSLCHAWSAAPTYDLPAEVAGIRPLAPGYSEYLVDLRPSGLTWLCATVPTPRGPVQVAYHERSDRPIIDSMGSEIRLPHTRPAMTVVLYAAAGATAHVRIPLQGIGAPTVSINAETLFREGVPVPGTGADHVRREDGVLTFRAPGGRYYVEIDR